MLVTDRQHQAIRLAAALCVALVCFVSWVPANTAFAEPNEQLAHGYKLQASSDSSWQPAGDSCEWQVKDGELDIRPVDSAAGGTLPAYQSSSAVPWYGERTSIRKVVVSQKVSATSCAYLFSGLTRLTSLDLAGLDTSNVTDFSHLFSGSSSLTVVDLGSGLGLDFTHATTFSHMFDGCSGLVEAHLSNIAAPELKDLSYLFNNCNDLRNVEFAGISAGRLDTLAYMFSNCTSLRSVDLSPLNTAYATDLSSIFSGCSSLTTFDAGAIDTSSATSISAIFSGCRSIKRLDVAGWDTSNVESMGYVFCNCDNLTDLDISNWNMKRVTDARSMFEGCLHLERIDLSALRGCENLSDVFRMFCLCSRLKTVDLRGIDFSKVDRLEEMFLHCENLKTIDARDVNFALCTNAFRMFEGCSNLTSANFSGAHFDMLYTTQQMFSSCPQLERVDFSKVYAPALADISTMFYNCANLRNVSFSGSTFSRIRDASYAFGNCSSLGALDLSPFMAIGPRITGLFSGCYVDSYIPMRNYTGDSPKTHPNISSVASLKFDDVVYTGGYIAPTITLTVPDNATYVWGSLTGKQLVEGTHYLTSYTSNRLVGTAKVTVTGIGIFRGTVTKSFKILPKGTSINKATGKKKAVKLTWSKQATQTSGYEIRYKLAKGSSKWKTVTVKATGTTSKTIKSLKSKKAYKVQIRTYRTVGGTKYYSAWSKEKTVNVK